MGYSYSLSFFNIFFSRCRVLNNIMQNCSRNTYCIHFHFCKNRCQNKATVLALREIAAGNITEEMLDEKPVINEEEGLFEQTEIDAEIGELLNADTSETQDEIESKSENAPEADENKSEAAKPKYKSMRVIL